MKLSVDLGYGFTKALTSKNGKVILPSVIAPAGGDTKAVDLIGDVKRPGHLVELRFANSTKRNRLFVGELALREGRAAQMSLARERFARDASLVLSMTGAYLAGAEGQIELAFGVPLAYYRHQKEEVIKALQGQAVYLSVDEGPEKYIKFGSVHVFAQGVGALFAAGSLPKDGLIGVVDVGYYTTDYLLVELRPEGIDPLPSYMSSIEAGVSTGLKLFAETFREQTGKPLSLAEAQSLWNRKEITFGGRKMDVQAMTDEARISAGRAIAEAVQAAWSEKIDFLDGLLLAGGGALEFMGVLKDYFRGVEVVPDPQFANAVGFLAMLERANPVPSVETGAISRVRTP